MQTQSIQDRLLELKYSDSINAQARAANSVIQKGSHRFKEAINNISILAQCSLLAHYQGVKQSTVPTLLAHKSDALEMYRVVTCSQISSVEQDILLGYINQTIHALDDGLRFNAKQLLVYGA